MFWAIGLAMSAGALLLTALLWWLDERCERYWQVRRHLEGMANLLAASSEFQAGLDRCTKTLRAATWSVAEFEQAWRKWGKCSGQSE